MYAQSDATIDWKARFLKRLICAGFLGLERVSKWNTLYTGYFQTPYLFHIFWVHLE
jgi:hypothetical protein